jgi:hypothetical protein
VVPHAQKDHLEVIFLSYWNAFLWCFSTWRLIFRTCSVHIHFLCSCWWSRDNFCLPWWCPPYLDPNWSYYLSHLSFLVHTGVSKGMICVPHWQGNLENPWIHEVRSPFTGRIYSLSLLSWKVSLLCFNHFWCLLKVLSVSPVNLKFYCKWRYLHFRNCETEVTVLSRHWRSLHPHKALINWIPNGCM